MNTIAVILCGLGFALIINYFAQLPLLYYDAITIHSNNKGIKNLKYQEYNPTWNRFVIRR
jgi:hypothetical protein